MRHYFESGETLGRVSNKGEGQKEHDLLPIALPLPYYNCKLKVPDTGESFFLFLRKRIFFLCICPFETHSWRSKRFVAPQQFSRQDKSSENWWNYEAVDLHGTIFCRRRQVFDTPPTWLRIHWLSQPFKICFKQALKELRHFFLTYTKIVGEL